MRIEKGAKMVFSFVAVFAMQPFLTRGGEVERFGVAPEGFFLTAVA